MVAVALSLSRRGAALAHLDGGFSEELGVFYGCFMVFY